MKLNRRSFLKTGALAVAGAGVLELEGCSPSTVYAQIEAWVPTALLALQGILTVIAPFVPISGTISVIVGLIKASFADLEAAVTEYQNAPAANKTTLLGKIRTVLQDIADNFGKFLADLNLGGNPMLTLVVSLVQVILNVLAGFANQLPGPAAMSRTYSTRSGQAVLVNPTKMSLKQFKAFYNKLAEQNGHPEIDLL
jgi:hypothetical protein